MNSDEIHICIVSDRLLPNLIPVLMHRPEAVMLLASDEMRDKGLARRCQQILQDHDIAVSISEGLPSSGLREIEAYALDRLAEISEKNTNRRLVLNITGGNKLMTIAFMRVMDGEVDRIVYTDTLHNRLEELTQDETKSDRARPLQSVIDVPLYLAAHGMIQRRCLSEDAAWRRQAKQRKALTKYLGKQSARLAEFIGNINGLCNQALDGVGKTIEAPVQCFRRRPTGSWREAMARITQSGLVRWDGDRTLNFPDAESARYLGGGWLEEYAWHQAHDLSPYDVRMEVEGTWEETKKWGRNELDLGIVHNNRLLLVECKTLKIGWDARQDDEMLYKLDSVGDDVKGLFGEAVLLSARKPSDAVIDRARHHGIHIVGPERIDRFQDLLKAWMDRGLFPTA